jgi:hypothetical protein
METKTLNQGIVQYPFIADCKYCGNPLRFDIDTAGTPGRNGDWGHNGDYGCVHSPITNEEGCGGHYPVDIVWIQPEEEGD